MENKETLEEAAERLYSNGCDGTDRSAEIYRRIFIEGAKWQMDRMYSEEEVLTLFKKYQYDLAQWVLKRERGSDYGLMPIPTEWFEEFKKTKDGK